MSVTSIWVLIAIGAYCLVCLFLGFYAEKGQKATTTTQYFLAGRNMGPFISILAMTTTQLSSFALLGMPGYFYTHGISPWVMLFVNCMGMIGWYYLFAFRFYFMGKKYNYLTVGDFFADRFGPKMHLVGSIAMIIITPMISAAAIAVKSTDFPTSLQDPFISSEKPKDAA